MELNTAPIVIPGIRRCTMRMLSEQYNIPEHKISNRYTWHKDELKDEVIVPTSREEFEKMVGDKVDFICKPGRSGSVGYLFTNAAFASISFGKTLLFSEKGSRRLVELANTDTRKGRPKKEKPASEDKPKTDIPKNVSVSEEFDSPDEERMLLNLAKAYKSGEIMNVLSAALALDEFRKSEIKDLKDKVDNARNYIPWTEHRSTNAAINALSEITEIQKYELWCHFYDKLMNDYNIDLRGRNKKPLINGLRTDEMYKFYQVFVDICQQRFLNIERVFNKAGINVSGLSIMVKY